MITIRQAVVLTGMIALVMVALAASSLLAPARTGDANDLTVEEPTVAAAAAEDEPIHGPAEERPSQIELVVVGEVVTRGEMAALLSGVLGLVDRADDPFVDDDSSPFEADIERLVAAGITRGCNPPSNDLFCPDDPVTRQVAATMLSRGFGLSARADNPFVDDDGSIFEPDIERLAAAGITRGCNPPANDLFCPDDPVSGDEMTVFLERAQALGR